MKASAVAAFAVLLAAPCVARTLTVGSYTQEFRETIKGYNKIWIDGVYNGLKAAGKPPMLCLPPKMTMTNDQILSVLDLYLAAHSTPKEATIDVVLLKALQEAFPCR